MGCISMQQPRFSKKINQGKTRQQLPEKAAGTVTWFDVSWPVSSFYKFSLVRRVVVISFGFVGS